jgi:anaerobic selenocysteine-containing dehydrogenase
VPESYIQINTIDARKLGIARNEKIRVSSRRGEIETLARISDDVAPGLRNDHALHKDKHPDQHALDRSPRCRS